MKPDNQPDPPIQRSVCPGGSDPANGSSRRAHGLRASPKAWWRPGIALAGALAASLAPARESPVPSVSPLPAPPVRDQTTSVSEQFIINGSDHDQRAALATRCEEIREAFVRLLDRSDTAPDPGVSVPEPAGRPQPIHIRIDPGAPAIVQPGVTIVEGTGQTAFSLVLRSADPPSDAFRIGVLRLLIAERMFRGDASPTAAGQRDLLPPWLVTGFAEAIDHAARGRPSARFAAIIRSGQLMDLDDLLARPPSESDAISREVFAASSCGLILMLLDQPQGPARFRRFLADRPAQTESSKVQLVRKFPGMALSRHSLEKWWLLELAALSEPGILEVLSPEETERRLAAALVITHTPPDATPRKSGLMKWIENTFSGKKNAQSASPATLSAPAPVALTIDQTAEIAALGKRSEVLNLNQTALAELHLRAFPLHRPVIDGYQQVLGLLIKGRTKGLAARIEALAADRRDILDQMNRIEDHLDWFEATQRETFSGTFDEILRRPPESTAPRRLKRNDPISSYLDEIEREFE